VHDVQLNVLADQPLDEVPQLVENVRDIEYARLQGLLTGKSQQLAHEISGAVSILLDLHDVCEGRIARRGAQQQQIAEPDHRGQQIIEIMRNAAGKLAYGLHLLRLGELDLEVLLFGDIDEMECKPAPWVRITVRHTFCVISEPAEVQNHSLVAWPLETDLNRIGIRVATDSRCELGADALAVFLDQ